LSTPPRQPDTKESVDRLVSDAANGDRRAAATLARQLLPRVRNLVRYLVRGDRDVDDITQDALVAVLRGLHSYRGEGAFRAWVDRVAARTAFGCLRSRRAEQEKSSHAAGLHAALSEDSAPADDYLAKRRLVRLLDALPFDQRHALVLHHVVGMTVAEVADEMEAPIETVRSRLRIGRERMRQAYSPIIEQEAG
jgi:RNA polymerase sigma-70 factor (ECF subfamily)